MTIESENILCKKCGYHLKGATEAKCPDCGAPFDPADPATFNTERNFHWRGALIVVILVAPMVIALLWLLVYKLSAMFG